MEPFLPMLAVRAEPFDADDYLFEVKWDGVRALAGRDRQGWRLWGRDLAAYNAEALPDSGPQELDGAEREALHRNRLQQSDRDQGARSAPREGLHGRDRPE